MVKSTLAERLMPEVSRSNNKFKLHYWRNLLSIERFEKLLTTKEAADLLNGMQPRLLMSWARLGLVPAHRLGRAWAFRASELNDWILGRWKAHHFEAQHNFANVEAPLQDRIGQ